MAVDERVGDAGIVTPEAVVLDLPVADVGSRSLAYAVDLAVVFVVFLGVVFLAGLVGIDDATSGVVLVVITLFVLLFVWPTAFETVSRGRSPGKMLLGLRVLTVEGGPVGLRHAAVRAALAPIEIIATAGGVAVAVALFTRRAQRLGDLVAGTVVVVARAPGRALTAASFAPPPGLESYVARLDVAGLSEQDYELVRALVLRDRSLPEGDRRRLAVEVAERLRGRLSPAPPADVDPVDYLTAVAAAYQGRFAARRDRDVAGWVWQQDGVT